MKIAYLAAGAAGMVCGSCLRDNRVASTLQQQGRDVVLLPLYTPLRTDEPDASEESPVFYGGVNVYLQHRSAIFRAFPKFMTRLLDSRFVLRQTARWAGSVDPKQLGALTVSVLEGKNGAQRRELAKLAGFLKTLAPTVIHLPNLLFVGVAGELKRLTGAHVVCTLSGEDIFLDDLHHPYRSRCFELIHRHSADVDAFVAVTQYYKDHAAKHFQLGDARIDVVPMGVAVNDFPPATPDDNDFTIGYLARICPAKGLANLADALIELSRSGRNVRVVASGYISSADRPYLDEIERKLKSAGAAERFTYLGEVTREQKINFLRSLHVLSVPTDYPEAKGLFVLEAMASGVPVVQPRHGSFPELVAATDGGVLFDAGTESFKNLAGAIATLMDDPALRRKLAEDGRQAVRDSFNDRAMADKTWAVYQSLSERNEL